MPSRRSKPRPPTEAPNATINNNQSAKSTSPSHPPDATNITNDTTSIAPSTPSSLPPLNWPSDIPYLTHPVISPYLPPTHLSWLRTKPQPQPPPSSKTDNESLPVIPLPLSPLETQSRVEIRLISDPTHPAVGQRGLFAVRDLSPGELVVAYMGYVHGSTDGEKVEWENRRREQGVVQGIAASGEGEDVDIQVHPDPPSHIATWSTSSYDLNMYRSDTIEVAIDAQEIGNEARFVNDYRGVAGQFAGRDGEVDRSKGRWKEKEKEKEKRGSGAWGGDFAIPNAEFRDVWFTGSVGEGTGTGTGTGTDSNAVNLNTIVHPATPSSPNATTETPADTLATTHLSTPVNPSTTTPSPSHTQSPATQPRNPRRKKPPGLRGVAIFVMPAGRSGKRKGGIKAGQEVLVSYGKGFWAHHGGEFGEVDGGGKEPVSEWGVK